MAGVDPFVAIGRPDPESERRARQLLDNVDSPKAGRRQHSLLALGALWFPLASCLMARPPHAMPTPSMLERVARCIGEDAEDSVRLAAIVATREGWRAFQVARARDPDRAPQYEVPKGSVAAIVDVLGVGSNLLRIAAARLLADFPSPELLPHLKAALADPVWTVRWNAVRALASLGSDPSLVEVLLQSRPREASVASAHDFGPAIAALKRSGVAVPPVLLAYEEPA
jgi:hypothetical protein